ncbi:hypothetical protein BABINDRAFT_15025 [Babjeviella inositovora NRRL Y-12698]|uniref:Protein kinase domain-containing protein n=1 Tax=Babjeviella inositovora NRRL Y-12698 TaxID=984486 RepID=A0A1E3QK75_9ASCO|nr:uncharacterized protein BABINDRAFT_15025 [Babjeviella inositovora NRRL Y-12698]ODQ78050.1 hypothetical protein BABINDRAFT_15025 [Babjeviella inositovora NRRL Y-12698]
MSLVLYNPSLDVVIHDPTKHAAVVYNKETNKLELLQIEGSEESDGIIQLEGTQYDILYKPHERRGSETPIPPLFSCPSCGYSFQFANGKARSASFFLEAEPENGLIPGPVYINHNYFQYLRDSTAGESPRSSLPDSIFTADYFANFFTPICKLGTGANGVVLKVSHQLFNYKLGTYALKKIPLTDDMEYLYRCLNEVSLVYELHSVNLVKYFHVWLEIVQEDGRLGVPEGTALPMCFILMEYCEGGDLEVLLDEFQSDKINLQQERMKRREARGKQTVKKGSDSRLLNTVEIVKFFRDIVNGVHDLHSHRVLHRDLKPSNCLLSLKYDRSDFGKLTGTNVGVERDQVPVVMALLPTILVSDFGETQFEGQARTATGNTGTVEFTAPELFPIDADHIQQFRKESDTYSLGVILVSLCFGELPFARKDEAVTFEDVVGAYLQVDGSGSPPWLGRLMLKRLANPRNDPLPSALIDLMVRMVSMDYHDRPLTEEILHLLDHQVIPFLGNPAAFAVHTDVLSRTISSGSQHTLLLARTDSAESSRVGLDSDDFTYYSDHPESTFEDEDSDSVDEPRGKSATVADGYKVWITSGVLMWGQAILVSYFLGHSHPERSAKNAISIVQPGIYVLIGLNRGSLNVFGCGIALLVLMAYTASVYG